MLSLKDKFFHFYCDEEIDYNSPGNKKWKQKLFFRIYNDSGDIIQSDEEIYGITGEYLTNNLQIYFANDDYKSLKRINDDQIIVGWREKNYTSNEEVFLGRIINYSGDFQGEEFEVSSTYEQGKINTQLNIKNKSMYAHLSGKIIIKTEDKGKAYYVNPTNKTMHYLGKPDDAFEVMRSQGIGITNKNLYKIAIGINSNGTDSDNDGLSDNLENALELNISNVDTDNDGYSDKNELTNGYNPWGTGKQALDSDFANKQSGKIFIQVEKNGEAWYVSPENKERYFLGRPVDAFNIMRNLGLGISNNDFNNM